MDNEEAIFAFSPALYVLQTALGCFCRNNPNILLTNSNLQLKLRVKSQVKSDPFLKIANLPFSLLPSTICKHPIC